MIEKCVDKLVENPIIYKIIIVDNNSEDNTKKLVRSKPKVRLMEQSVNLGFGKANNIGIQEALDKYPKKNILLINQDAYIDYENLLILTRTMIEWNYNILSPLHLNGCMTKVDPNFFEVVMLQTSKSYLQDLVLRRPVKEVYEANLVNAAIWLLPGETFIKFGLFDPMFSHYGEDNEFSLRVAFFGGKVGFTPLAEAVHLRISPVSLSHKNDNFIKHRIKINRFQNDNLVLLTDKNRKILKALMDVFRVNCREMMRNIFKMEILIFSERVLALLKTFLFAKKICESRTKKIEDYSL